MRYEDKKDRQPFTWLEYLRRVAGLTQQELADLLCNNNIGARVRQPEVGQYELKIRKMTRARQKLFYAFFVNYFLNCPGAIPGHLTLTKLQEEVYSRNET